MLRFPGQIVKKRSFTSHALWLLLGVGLLIGLSGLAPHTTSQDISLENIKLDRPYAVHTIADQCSLDLAFHNKQSYLLIISSLGNPHQDHQIELSSRPISKRKACPITRITGYPLSNSQQAFHSDAIRLHTNHPAGSQTRNPVQPLSNGKQRDFHLHVTEGSLSDAKQYATIRTTRIASSTAVQIYLDRQHPQSQLAPGVANFIVDQLEQEIIPHLQSRLGEVRDIDGDGKLSIVLTPWLQQLQGGKTALGGMVRPADFDNTIPSPFSNQADVLYLNTNVKPGPHLQTLLMHELTHAVCISERQTQYFGSAFQEEDWLNEALAHVMEIQAADHWSNLDYRISRYLNATERYPLVIPNYYEAGLWRNHGCRGATFLFLQWCVDRYGERVLPNLVHSQLSGTENIAAATQTSFDTLFRLWTISLLPPRYQQSIKDSANGYQTTLNIYQQHGKWNLTGPNITSWQTGEKPLAFALKGTSAAYVRIHAAEDTRSQRIQIQGTSGSELQVTLIPCSQPCSQLSIRTAAHQLEESENILTLSLSMSDLHAERWTVSSISCECNQGETKQSICFSDPKPIAKHQPHRLKAAAETARINYEATDALDYRLVLPAHLKAGTAEWTVQVLAKTASGDVLTARTTIQPTIH